MKIYRVVEKCIYDPQEYTLETYREKIDAEDRLEKLQEIKQVHLSYKIIEEEVEE